MSNYITAAKINLMYILCFIDSFMLLIFMEQVYFSVDAACFFMKFMKFCTAGARYLYL